MHNDNISDEGNFMGAGHVLAGEVLNPDNMPHHQRNPAQLAGTALLAYVQVVNQL